MPYNAIASDEDSMPTGHVVGAWTTRAGHYGVAVKDIFSDADWAPAEPVRARDWHDIGSGPRIESSETNFD